jgi:hypothetical protein
VDDVAASGTSIDEAPPTLFVRIAPRKSLPRALERGLRPLVSVDEAASVRAAIKIGRRIAEELELPRKVGEATATMAAAAELRLIVPFSDEARAKLAELQSLRVKLRVSARDATGATSTVFHRVLLVR